MVNGCVRQQVTPVESCGEVVACTVCLQYDIRPGLRGSFFFAFDIIHEIPYPVLGVNIIVAHAYMFLAGCNFQPTLFPVN